MTATAPDPESPGQPPTNDTGPQELEPNQLPHTPRRPIWLCGTCATEWPCLTVRTLLPLDYYDSPTALHVYLATLLQEAVEDLTRLNPDPGPDPQRMHARFLGWVKPWLDITRRRAGGPD
ncbi:hypothetical protein [Plantactinospora soyae]|uniref:Flavin reductase n=1 Tax=Plantactinospora soyae TaxID=1544732 RepID=A0A927LZL6_9ACTN|nr:hypothetical protein [Plantactinospora soyae]MBE1485448.1 hypothetical protein [Plantactinospora soyae]